MISMKNITLLAAAAIAGMLGFGLPAHAAPKAVAENSLTSGGEALLTKYTKMLDELKAEVQAAVAAVDETKKSAFMAARAEWSALKAPGPEATADEQKASERSCESGGIFQRLAPGTALHTPWEIGKDKRGVYGIVHRTDTDTDQVERYMHYEKAYLDGELDPAFKDMTTWECRFITDDPHSDEDLAWMRRMRRIYRPDHITYPDYKWRYVRIVKDDMPYCSTTHDPSLGSTAQEALALGGICGRRAFMGRLALRAFGVPARASTQTGVVKDAEIKALELTGCMKLGESDELIGDETGIEFVIPEDQRQIAVAEDGVITIPGVACYSPRKPSDRVVFIKSRNEGFQIHYGRLGQRPELIKYRIEAPAAGDCELTSQVATVSNKQEMVVRMNREEPVSHSLPYTKGAWMEMPPLKVKIEEGRNMISITARAPNRGISIKSFQLKPVK